MKSALVLLLIACSLAVAEPNGPSTNSVAVRAGRLIDAINGKTLERQVILIDAGEIKAVGAEGSVAIPSSVPLLDLSSATVLPGLIDCHTHITSEPGENYYEDLFRRSPIDLAVLAHLYARRTLEAGFT